MSNAKRRGKVIGGVGSLVLVLVLALLGACLNEGGGSGDAGGSTDTSGSTDPVSGLPWVDLDQLPAEAGDTVELIENGGPFPYDKDGSTFGNREGILPDQSNGYYKEYTVPTPGEGDRGARRIVTGDDDREMYYTGDHYDSFERIRT